MPKKTKVKVKAKKLRMEVTPENKRRHIAPPRRETIKKYQGKNMANDPPLD